MRRKGGPEFLGYLSRARVEGSLKTVSDHSSLSSFDTSSCDSGTPRLLLLGHPYPKKLDLIKVLEGLTAQLPRTGPSFGCKPWAT